MARLVGGVGGATCAFVAMVCLGSSAPVSSRLSHYPVFTGQALRYLVAGLVLLLVARPRVLPRRGDVLMLVLLALTGLAGFNVLVLEAVRRTHASTVGAVIGMAPIVLAVVGPLWQGRSPQARVIVAALTSVIGVLVIQAFAAGPVSGLLLALGALACECCFSLFAVGLLRTLGPVLVSAYACLAAACLLAVAAAARESSVVRAPTVTEWIALGYLSIVVTAIAFVLWYAGVGVLGIDRAGLFVGVVPATAALLAPVIADEPLRAPVLAGAAIIALATLWGATGRSRAESARRRPSSRARVDASPGACHAWSNDVGAAGRD